MKVRVRLSIFGGKMRLKVLVLGIVLSLSLGCATLGSLDKSAEQMTHDAIVQSEVLHNANAISDAQFKAINVELNKVAVAGLAFTKLLEAGQATPSTASQFLEVVIQEAQILKAAFPSSPLIDKVLADFRSLKILYIRLLPNCRRHHD